MKNWVLISGLFFLTSCYISYPVHQVPKKVDGIPYAQSFVDSLIGTNSIDTIVVYKKDCTGCIPDLKKETVYVFWQDKKSTVFKSFDIRNGISAIHYCDDIFSFYRLKHNDIISQEFTSPYYIIDHYQFDDVVVIINGKEVIKKHVPDYYKNVNDEKAIINWIYRIQAAIFNSRY